MKTVYLCGGINGLSDSDCKDWRNKVKESLDGLYHFLDPMRRDYRGKEDQSVHSIVHGDYHDIDKSDIILALVDKPSWGTAMEIHYAFEAKKEVISITNQEKVSPWLKYHSHVMIKSLDEAIQLLKANANPDKLGWM